MAQSGAFALHCLAQAGAFGRQGPIQSRAFGLYCEAQSQESTISLQVGVDSLRISLETYGRMKARVAAQPVIISITICRCGSRRAPDFFAQDFLITGHPEHPVLESKLNSHESIFPPVECF